MGEAIRDLRQRLIPRDSRLTGNRGACASLHFHNPLRLAASFAGNSGFEAVEQFDDQPSALIVRELKRVLQQLSWRFRHVNSLLSAWIKWKREIGRASCRERV